MSEPIKNKSPRPILGFIIKAALVCLLVGFVVWDAIPNRIGPRRSGPAWNANGCINNLRQIDAAKNEWALVNGKTNGVVTENDIKIYIKLDAKGNLPKCPSGGTYTIGKIGDKPTCSLGTTVTPAHVLP
jgi:hypothetical protein